MEITDTQPVVTDQVPESLALSAGIQPVQYLSINGSTPQEMEGEVVDETLACISVNGEELATFMCSPRDLKQMAVGFLYNEGLINQFEDVRHLHVSGHERCVDVWLHELDRPLPTRKIITAGCGGGLTFDDLSGRHEPLYSDLTATPEQLSALMREVHLGAELYKRARGIHTAALADGDQILLQVEDVGRHNCLDKLAGAALMNAVDTRDKVILSSGRISSEMLNKARRMGIPIVCSRTSPTSLSVALANAWQITIVAYLRQSRMRVYTTPQRINV